MAKNWRPISVGLFIRDYLLERGEACPYEVFKALQGKKRGASYSSVRKFFHALERLGLIEFVRSEPSKRPKLAARRYYKLVSELKDHPAWGHPQVVLWPSSRFGGARYAEKREEARRLRISLDNLALKEDPQLRRERKSLKI